MSKKDFILNIKKLEKTSKQYLEVEIWLSILVKPNPDDKW